MRELETNRLTLLPWPEHHAEFVADIQRDPLVMRYLGNGVAWDRERFEFVRGWQADHWATHGFGWRIAVERDRGDLIGVATSGAVGEGVADLDPREHELGWWIASGAWRQGYGTEIGLALRAEAHEVHGSPEVLARLQPENAGSVGVARKIGLRYVGAIQGRFGEPNAVYRGTAEEWNAR